MKKLKQAILFLLIIVCTLILIGFQTESFSLSKDDLFKNKCEVIYHPVGDRNIILRVDDIQEYAWFDSQKRIIEDASKRGIPLVLGVIPSRFEEDKRIWDLIMQERCEMEIALHGFEHTSKEFGNLSFKEADEKMKKGLKVLNDIEPNIMTFIPPNNVYSKETELAAKYNGFHILSSRSSNNEYGYTQSTYDWTNLVLEDYKTVLLGCKNDLDNNKTCIIMIHPQDFVTDHKLDERKYEEYLNLLDSIKSLDANIINFRDLIKKDYIILN